MIIVAKIL